MLAALELAASPALVRRARRQPLPEGVLEVIRAAAGSEETLAAAARAFRKDPAFVQTAAAFYVQQLLLFSGADSYRVLGVPPGASREQMREHMRWLMAWLHPDRASDSWRAVFAGRVLAAWREAGGKPPGAPAPARAIASRNRRRSMIVASQAWRMPLVRRRRRRGWLWKWVPLTLAASLGAMIWWRADATTADAALWLESLFNSAFDAFAD